MANRDIPTQVQQRFLKGIARIAQFWGFPKAMGAAYGAVYLSPSALSLDDLIPIVGISKGALSIHMRSLERLGIVFRESQPGDRKDYYSANTDFWDAVRRILQEREQREFDRALRTVRDCLTLLDEANPRDPQAPLIAFYRERLLTMQRFFDTLDRLVATILAIEDFRQSAFQKLLTTKRRRKQ